MPEELNDIRFETNNINGDKYYHQFEIHDNSGRIYVMKINFIDLKTKYLLYLLNKYIKNINFYKSNENANVIMRNSIGLKYQRYTKLKNINGKNQAD